MCGILLLFVGISTTAIFLEAKKEVKEPLAIADEEISKFIDTLNKAFLDIVGSLTSEINSIIDKTNKVRFKFLKLTTGNFENGEIFEHLLKYCCLFNSRHSCRCCKLNLIEGYNADKRCARWSWY